MPIIETLNLSKTYQSDSSETPAIRNVSLKIESGEFVAIMGPSGSGKSTLLHILGFLDSLSGGEYIFDGKSASKYSEIEKAKIRNQEIGFVFQAFNLLPKTTVLENVKLPLLYSSVPETEWDNLARQAAESVGLSHRIYHESSQLSGGEKQRAAIGRALILKPKIIFADEPTGNLDSKSGKAIMEIIQHLHEEHGNTVVLITHETYTAEHAERIIHILDGEIEKDEVVKEKHKTTDEFIK